MSYEWRRLQLARVGKVGSVTLVSIGMTLLASPAVGQQSGQQTFKSPAAACHALIAALKSDDESALVKILGPDSKEIVATGNPAEDKQRHANFVQKYEQMHRLVNEPDGKTTLYVGAENWPAPIPLVHKGNSWYFDTPAGREEILYRRVGRNELAVIQICHELVDAQKEYYAQPHDGSANEYAQKLTSDPGKHNGLYWEAGTNESQSPIGPLIAAASPDTQAADQNPEPFHGYYFRILTGQKSAKGTESYIEDGKMTRGFAVLAYPADYRATGVMTFIVDQDGVVYEKDLGKRTTEAAKTLTVYSRDATWRKAD
jgi:hypothetical protein